MIKTTTQCVTNTWANIRSAIKNSAKAIVGTIVRNKPKRTPNDIISELSKRQKDSRLQIQNTENRERKVELKKGRNKVLHTIRKTELEERNKELEAKVENISNANSDHAMFNAVKLLNQRQYKNPSVDDTTGKLVTNPDQTLEIISGFFKDKFQNKDLPNITSFQGPPKKLNKPITPEEVRKSLESLKNNKAPGEDEISRELLNI